MSEIEELKKIINKHERRISNLEGMTKTEEGKKQKKTSLKEFIISKNPKGDVKKALTIGYYLEKHEDEPFFNANDLKKGFKESKEKIPDNISDKISKNIKKGHMMKYEEKKEDQEAYVLTNSGERYLENDFKE